MTQAMVLIGILVICAASGAVLTYRHGRANGPDEPTGSYTAPPPPLPKPPPAPAPVAPKPSQPLPARTAVVPPPPPSAPVRRTGRNSGFNRFTPAGEVRRVKPGVVR